MDPQPPPARSFATALKALKALGRVFRVSSTAVGGTVIVGAAVGAVVASDVRKKQLELPSEFVLDLDLRGTEMVERAPAPFFRFGGVDKVEVADVVKALEEAGKDQRVKGLLATLPDTIDSRLGGIAQIQEVRSAVLRFRLQAAERNATSVAYSSTYGSTSAFYLASAFQDVYLQPTGLVMCTGIVAKVPFFRGLLDKWKVVPIGFAREEYKNGANPLLEKAFTAPHRESVSGLILGLSDQVIGGIAAGRGLTTRVVTSAVDRAPLTALEAVSAGLITGAKYEDEASAIATAAEGRSPERPLKKIPYKRFLKAAKLKEQIEQRKKRQSWIKQSAHVQEEHADEKGISNDVGVKSKDTAADEELLPDDPLSYLKLESQKRLNQIKEGLAGLQESLSLLSKGEGWRQEWWSYWKERGLAEWYDAVAASLAGDLGPDEVSPFPVAPPSPKVALVYALGPIDTGSQGGLSRRDNQIDSSRVCAHLEELRHDKAIRAVVLRVDSPGGSAVASDAIHRELSLLRKSGKPVVVSMGNVAASGGYYIACAADKILASPATVTGSIGVLIFKLNAHGLLEDKGVNVETVKVGKNADLLSPVNGITSDQKRTLNKLLDTIYHDFMNRVVEGRGLTKSQVGRIAKGKIYLGTEAKKLGLVDELGGLNDAVRIAKELAELPEDVPLVQWPARPTPLQAIKEATQGKGGAEIISSALDAATQSLMGALAASVVGGQVADVLMGNAKGPQAVSLEAGSMGAARS